MIHYVFRYVFHYLYLYFIDCDEKHASKPRFRKKKEIDAMSCSVLFDHPLGMGWSLKLYHLVVTWNLTATLRLHSISVTLTMKSF